MRLELRALVFAFSFQFLFVPAFSACLAYQGDELSEEEAKQVQATDRFLKVLEKSPRRGTALDRVYGHHVEFGSLDGFIAKLQDRTTKDPKDSDAWMLLGLFESQRGADAAAVEAFSQASTLRPNDPMAPYYLGQSLLRIGQSAEAVTALERALERKPARNDLLEIFQQLGRVHQRAQRTDDALKVWQRLETLFPDDPRVLEQIAVTLAEEGGHALALPRYERLAKLVKDDYRRVLFRVEAAGLKVKTNQRDVGINDMESVLQDLNPDSWLYRDVRRRIENVFLKSGDQDNLVKYYEKWLSTRPEDIEAMARLAKFLASSARVPEATVWMEKALKLAPSRADLRKAFIDQLVDDQRIPEAIKQYEQLVASAPSNPDFLRDWGKLVLKDKSQDADVRKKEAVRVWSQIVAIRPNDASNLAQVADLYRQSNLTEEATGLYQKAVEVAPNEPQYREYLGEYLHIQKRSDEAALVWKSIAEGTRRTAENITRLAEVYNSFGFNQQSASEIAEACKMSPKDFSLQLRSADYHMRADKTDEALGFIDAAEKLAANEDERSAIIKQRIEVFQSSQRLDAEIEKLSSALRSNAAATAEQWHVLARYLEAERQWASASEAINEAIGRDEKSIPILTTAAKIAEASGDFGQAAQLNRKLASVDRRSIGDHLMNVARLEAQLGRSDEALKASQDLIVSAPGNTDNYEFLAQMCFRLGKQAEGLEALRKAVRINPNEPHLIMALGGALSDQLRTEEAIEVYWRAFEKSDELDDKTSLVLKLVPLYLQINQFEKLVERLERDRREEEKRREMTICLAQAHNLAGDYGTARQELESLLSKETRDTNLLQQLAKLCEGGSDLEAAIGYQRQLVAIAPGAETEFPLAKMLQTRGDRDEATEILVKLTRREEDPAKLLKSVDSLLQQSSLEAAISILDPLLSQQRDDWELIYREGVAWAMLNKREEASLRFKRLLALSIPHDSMGTNALAKFKQAQAKAKSDNLRGASTQLPARQSPLTLLNMSSAIQRAVGLSSDNYYSSSSGPPPVWMPDYFCLARMASYGWLLKFEEDAKGESSSAVASKNSSSNNSVSTDLAPSRPSEKDANASFADEISARASEVNASRDATYDALYLATLRNKNDEVFNMARRLAKTGGKEEKSYFLNSLQLRGMSVDQGSSVRANEATQKKTPLTTEDLDLMMACFDSLGKLTADDLSAAVSSSQIIYSTSGQAYVNVGGQYIQISGAFSQASNYMGMVVKELQLAGREQQAKDLIGRAQTDAKSAAQLAGVLALLFEENKLDEASSVYARWIAQAKQDIAKAATAVPTRQNRLASQRVTPLAGLSNLLMRWMGKLGPDEEHAQILSILDPALDLAIEGAKQRRTEQSKLNQRQAAVTSGASAGQYYLECMYGKERIQARLDFPRPNVYLDQTTLGLIREVFEVFKRNDVVADLPAHLRKRLEKAPEDDRLYEQLMLAAALWWTEDQDESVELMTKVSDALKEDINFRFEMAAMREMRGDLDDALEIIESIMPRDQQWLQRKELAALQIAERLGDNERAFAAAERLFGLRLDTNTQLNLAQRMRRLGLHELADAVISRAERKAGSQSSSLLSLMTMYQGLGKTDEAKQIAHMLLQRTSAANSSAMASSTRNPFRYSQSGDATRRQALQVLVQTGDLKNVIAQVESQLARSPDSTRLYEQLIEYYNTLGDKNKVGELLEKAVAKKPDSIVLRYQWTKNLESNNKLKEACDQYLELLRSKPEWVMDDFYSVRNVFQRANRTPELVDALKGMNVRKIQQPYYIIDLVSNLMGDEKNSAVAIELLEKVFDAFPSYRSNMLSNLRNPKLWQNDRLFEIGKRSFIPTESQVDAKPWFGVDQIYSYSTDSVNSSFSTMIQSIGASGKQADMEKAISEGVQKMPGWLGGKTMLGIMDLNAGRKEQGAKRFMEVLDDASVLKGMPSSACWIVGQELDRTQDGRPLAIKLFEQALATTDSGSMQQIQYSPAARLVKVYTDSGRKEDARTLILKLVRNVNLPNYDAQYASNIRIENSMWAANKFLEIGMPVDAVRLYRESTEDQMALELAASWNGRQPDYYATQANKGIAKALQSLNSDNASEAMTHLLTTPERLPTGSAAIDLILSIPDSKTIQTKRMESGLSDLFKSLAETGSAKRAIDMRMADMQANLPKDLSIGVAHVLFRSKSKLDDIDSLIDSLVAAVKDNPLDAIAEGRQPNSRQRKEAMLSVPLWLVARECLRDKAKLAQGQALAERALLSARRQVGYLHSASILMEWTSILTEQGDRVGAEEKLSELLKIATERPKRKPAPAPSPNAALNQVNPATGVAQRGPSPAGAAVPQGLALPPGVNLPPQVAQRLAAGQLPGQPARPSAGAIPSGPTSSGPNPSARSAGDTIPPLTMSQFNLAMMVSLLATENDMHGLSRKAVKDALAGGIPIDDVSVPQTSRSISMAGGVVTASTLSSANARPGGNNTNESQVSQALQKTIAKWNGTAYPPGEVYDLLKALVLPSTRPTEVHLYTDTSNLREARLSSLGESLVAWAKKAGKTEELESQLEERKRTPATIIPATVMQTLIAIGSGQTEKAKTRMDELGKECAKPISPALMQTASHAALRATTIPSLKDAAISILKKGLEQQTLATIGNQSNNSNPFGEPSVSDGSSSMGKLAEMVHRHVAESGNSESVKKYFESLVASRQSYYARYSDGGIGQQKSDIATFASEAARIGITDVAMDFAGRSLDLSTNRYGSISMKLPLAVAARELRGKPPVERYNTWRTWTMPAPARKTIRFSAELMIPTTAPEPFLKLAATQRKPLNTDFVCNFTELVDAAKESAQLDELQKQSEQAIEEKIMGADVLLALIAMERADPKSFEPAITTAVNNILERKKPPTGPTNPASTNIDPSFANLDYVLFSACMRSSEFANAYLKALGKTQFSASNVYFPAFPSRTTFEFANRLFADTHATAKPGEDARFVHWISASNMSEPATATKSWWYVSEGRLNYLAGLGADTLYFKYPLEGDFEVSVESSFPVSGSLGFGGCLLQDSQVASQSGGESIYQYIPRTPDASTDTKAMSMRSSIQKQAFTIDHREIYSEGNSKTSPWIALSAPRGNMASFRNVSIYGSPVIPRSVKLLDSDSMDGWNCTFFNETRFKKRLMAVQATENDSNYYTQQREPTTFDWAIKDGVLHADAATDLFDPRQSWIFYHRPLDSGETFAYEFFHKSGESVAYPTLGRIAFLLDSNGSKAHWIAQANWDDAVDGIPLDNAIEEPTNRRGSGAPPLKDGDWNSVELTLKDHVATVSLNGVIVYERPHEQQLDTRFGIFRYKNQAAKIRNASLKGPWPTELTAEMRQGLFATDLERTPVDRRAINSVMLDRFADTDVRNTVAQSRKLTDEHAFDMLRQWTLPSDDHSNFRLYYRLESPEGTGGTPHDSKMDHSDTERLLSPAIELVQLAAKLKRLDELALLVRNTETKDPLQTRNKNAIQALIAIEQRNDALIRKIMADVYTPVAQGMPKDMESRDRAAEFVVAWHAASHPGLTNMASDIAIALTKTERNKDTTSNNAVWKTHLGILSGRLANAMASDRQPSLANDPSKQWQTVPFVRPADLPAGNRRSSWTFSPGTLQHITGGSPSMLYFQSPLKGKFEIVAQRSMFNNRDVAIAYGMHAVDLIKGKQAISVSKLLRAPREIEQKVNVPDTGDLFEHSVAVDGNRVKTSINGIVVHEERFSEQPDPWIVLQAKQPHFASVIRDLRILGSPEIPSEIDLIKMGGWAGWRADRFGETHSGDRGLVNMDDGQMYYRSGQSQNEPWQLMGDELVGTLRAKSLGSVVSPSWMKYQRPMLEDGTIEWESFYTPGEFEVHPSVGNVVYCITPKGVATKPIDNNIYKTSEVAIDGSASIELREKDWNRFKLAMKGNRVSLFVNNHQVAEFPAEISRNERHFGLFRYSDKYQCRVRNLIYRGEWPKTLPSIADQELAYPKGGPYQLPDGDNLQTTEIVMNQSMEAIKKAGIKIQGRADQFTVTDSGLKIAMRNASTYEARPLLQLSVSHGKDCDVTVDYQDASFQSAKQGWGTLFALVASLDDAEQSSIEGAIKKNLEGDLQFIGSRRRNQPSGIQSTVETFFAAGPKESGRIRLARRGGEIHFLHAEKGSDEFQLIHSVSVGNSSIKSMKIEAKSSDDIGQIDVTLTKLSIRTYEK
ncbi:MAG: DUF1583 domain-containing protein [Pirellula sp.]